ncbi:MAG: CHASE2 domain-containing protein [Thiohalomonadales bacterium]
MQYFKKDWFIALFVSLFFLLFANSNIMKNIEWAAYDLGVRFSSTRPANQDVVIVAIDDASIQELGSWPWPRDMLAKITSQISKARPNVIGFGLQLDARESTRGLKYIQKLRNIFNKNWGSTGKSIKRILDQAESGLDTDKKFIASLKKAGPVVLAVPYLLEQSNENITKNTLEKYSRRLTLKNVTGQLNPKERFMDRFRPDLIATVDIMYPPLEEFVRQSNAIGHLNLFQSNNTNARMQPLILSYDRYYVPSFALMLASQTNHMKLNSIHVELGNSVHLGKTNIISDPQLRMYPYFYSSRGDKPAFNIISIKDVYNNNVRLRSFRNKTVLIGLTASQYAVPMDTPLGKLSPILVTANSVSSILNGDLYNRPGWGAWFQLIVLAIVALYLMIALPRFRLGTGLAFSVLFLIALFNLHFILMVSKSMWIPLMLPSMALITGHIVLMVKHVLESRVGHVKEELSEANQLLAQSFQSQGHLDQAFDRFRKCVIVSNDLFDQMYNLGLDYERKRQFNKAESVFRYIMSYDQKFRDVRDRLERNKQASATSVLTPGTSATGNSTLVLNTTGIQKPILGRYLVDKEIGRGAMGLVYLGSDPKIGRTVAIKTMSLGSEFEGAQLKDVKDRFFREAETAGRLNHPNIVTIYDVGEDQELAYIAMDFLKGDNLLAYCKADTLLPVVEVIDIIIMVGEALEYASSQNVVHRDIKPANIIYDRDNSVVKVTDFGVACLTDVSKTKTGTILGSPSYMSPEQLAGKKVDGRSDLFSLTVTLYQMLAGELPFIGESLASLMYKIANEKHPDVRMFRPDLPQCMSKIINKGLQKDAEKRFQSGIKIVNSLKRCRDKLND